MGYYIDHIGGSIKEIERRNGQFRLPPYWVAEVIRPSRAVRGWLRAHGFAWCARRREWWRGYITRAEIASWIGAE